MSDLEKFIVPIGPQHPALKEPGHFEFTVDGETVTAASVRLGYVHRGIEKATERPQLDAESVSARTRLRHLLAHARAVLLAGRGSAGRSHRAAARAGDSIAGGRIGTRAQSHAVAGRGRARSRVRYAVHVQLARSRKDHGRAGNADGQPRQLFGQCAGRREVRRGREAGRRHPARRRLSRRADAPLLEGGHHRQHLRAAHARRGHADDRASDRHRRHRADGARVRHRARCARRCAVCRLRRSSP